MRRCAGTVPIALGVGLAANSLLGPLATGVIRYRFSDSLLYQGIGLDFVSLVVVAPLAVAAGVLTLRRRLLGPALGLGIGAYAAYMAIQYVVGPEYGTLPGNNERFFLLHLGLLVLGLATTASAWAAMPDGRLPPTTAEGERRWGALSIALGVLLLLRYLPGLVALTTGGPTPPEFRENATSYLLIASLDLGVFLPAAVAAGVALRRGLGWARKALHLVVGWLALVGLAVAAMGVTMRLHEDPAMSGGQLAAFVVVGAALALLYVWLERPLAGEGRSRGRRSPARPKGQATEEG